MVERRLGSIDCDPLIARRASGNTLIALLVEGMSGMKRLRVNQLGLRTGSGGPVCHRTREKCR